MANTWWGLLALLPFAAYLQFCIIPGEEAYLRARFKGALAWQFDRIPETNALVLGWKLRAVCLSVCLFPIVDSKW